MTQHKTEAPQDELAGIREKIARRLWYFHTGAIMSRDDKVPSDYLLHADQILSLIVSSGGGVCPRCSRFGDSKGSICMYHKDRKPYWSKCPTCNGTGHTKVVEKTLEDVIKEALK